MATLRIYGADRVLETTLSRSILDIVMDNAIPISTSCGGVAACGLCRVSVRAGMEHLTEANEREHHHLGSATVAAGTRLACQARFVTEGEVEVDIPPVPGVESRQEKYTRMMRARRAEVTARGRGRTPAKQPSPGKSNATPGALVEGGEQPSGRRRRRRRKR